MLTDEEYITWLKETKKLINRYRIKRLIVEAKEMHPLSELENRIVEKDMMHVKIKDVHEILIDDSIYDMEDNNE